MDSSAQKIINEASRLSPIERAEVIERIIESFDIDSDIEIKSAWAEEAERRLALHKNGDSETFSEEEVFKNIESDIKK